MTIEKLLLFKGFYYLKIIYIIIKNNITRIYNFFIIFNKYSYCFKSWGWGIGPNPQLN